MYMQSRMPNPALSVFAGGCIGSDPRSAFASSAVTIAQTSIGPAAVAAVAAADVAAAGFAPTFGAA